MVSPDHFIIVYDIHNDVLSDWMGIPFGILPAIAGLGLATLPRRFLSSVVLNKLHNRVRICFGLAICAIAASVVLVPTWLNWREHDELVREFEAGQYKIIEGTRRHFSPTPGGGHGQQSFDVDGRNFSFWEHSPSSSFHGNNALWTAYIRPIKVKLFVIGNKIVHVEIATATDPQRLA